MKRHTALFVTGALICSLNAPLYAYAANTPVSDGKSVSSECPNKKHMKKKHKIDVDALVNDKVISQETGERVKVYLKEHFNKHKAEREKVKSMNEDERKAYFQNKYPNGKPDVWKDMAEAGVITQEEAGAIKAALQAKRTEVEKVK